MRPLTPEQQELAADPRHLRLAHRLAARHAGGDFDTAHSAALHGLVRAAGRYDPAGGVPFGAYAARRIVGEILETRRSGTLLAGGRRGRAAVVELEAEPAARTRGPWAAVDAADAAASVLAVLTAREREAVRLYYLGGASGSLRALGALLGCSRTVAHRLVCRAVTEIRRRYTESLA